MRRAIAHFRFTDACDATISIPHNFHSVQCYSTIIERRIRYKKLPNEWSLLKEEEEDKRKKEERWKSGLELLSSKLKATHKTLNLNRYHNLKWTYEQTRILYSAPISAIHSWH